MGEPLDHPDVVSWQELLRIGGEQPEDDLIIRHKMMAINQCAMYVYTSGTTGMPKGNEVILNYLGKLLSFTVCFLLGEKA